jgi:ATP/maltotriose-dependent transcriptional regulator MalT
MAVIMDSIGRRRMLNDTSADPAKLSSYAREFVDQGFLSDAIDFFEKAGDSESLEGLLQTAVSEGDLFLVRRILKILGRKPDKYLLKSVAENADRLGKTFFAGQARESAEDNGEGR